MRPRHRSERRLCSKAAADCTTLANIQIATILGLDVTTPAIGRLCVIVAEFNYANLWMSGMLDNARNGDLLPFGHPSAETIISHTLREFAADVVATGTGRLGTGRIALFDYAIGRHKSGINGGPLLEMLERMRKSPPIVQMAEAASFSDMKLFYNHVQMQFAEDVAGLCEVNIADVERERSIVMPRVGGTFGSAPRQFAEAQQFTSTLLQPMVEDGDPLAPGCLSAAHPMHIRNPWLGRVTLREIRLFEQSLTRMKVALAMAEGAAAESVLPVVRWSALYQKHRVQQQPPAPAVSQAQSIRAATTHTGGVGFDHHLTAFAKSMITQPPPVGSGLDRNTLLPTHTVSKLERQYNEAERRFRGAKTMADLLAVDELCTEMQALCLNSLGGVNCQLARPENNINNKQITVAGAQRMQAGRSKGGGARWAKETGIRAADSDVEIVVPPTKSATIPVAAAPYEAQLKHWGKPGRWNDSYAAFYGQVRTLSEGKVYPYLMVFIFKGKRCCLHKSGPGGFQFTEIK
eukprot:COSAG04_NODE_1682_length_5960_cov_43.049480_3_plen_519_part_00